MTFEYGAAEHEDTEILPADNVSDDLHACMLDCWRDDIQSDISWWMDPVGQDPAMKREDLRQGPEHRDCILETASWPGVSQQTWAEFQDFMRAQVFPVEPRDSLEEREARIRAWYKDDPRGFARCEKFVGLKTIPRDFRHWRAAVQAGDRDCFVWLAREAIVMQIGFPGIEPADWYRFRMAARTWRDPRDAPEPKAKVGTAPTTHVKLPAAKQHDSSDAKLFQKILALAFDAVSPNRATVPAEAVRPRFIEAYPQGKDTSPKQSAAAVRKAWSRALRYPPAGIAVSGGYISARAA